MTPTRARVPHLAWAALVIALAAWLVYRPALNRVFVSDQVWYFAELGGSTSLADGLSQYDYAASRRYWKGDDALFRPALFAWLAVGNSLFSYHHVAWNIATLVLHVLVAIALFRLLVTIRPSPFALPIAVLFVVLKPQLELVLWQHLGGYLLGCWCVLLGLRAFVQIVQAPAPPPRAYGWMALALTAASFFHEAMVPIAVLAGVIVFAVDRRRGRAPSAVRLATLAAPVVIFAIAYAFHAGRVSRLNYVDRPDFQHLFDATNLLEVVPRSLALLWNWLGEVFVPASLTLQPELYKRLVKHFIFNYTPLEIANALLALAALIGLMMSVSRAGLRRHASLLTCLAGSLVAYAGVICLGRAQHDVLTVTYYLYPFSLLLLVLGYALIDVTRAGPRLRVAGAGLVAAFVLLHGLQTLGVTRASGQVNRSASLYLTRVSAFVDAHKHEPDFTFAIADRPLVFDPAVPLKVGYPDENGPTDVRRLTEILFAKYYRADRPKYVYGQ